MGHILTEFEKFPKERDLIGQMLLVYGEFEFVFVVLIAAALNIENSAAGKMLFRVNGEYSRLQVVDAIVRPVRKKHNLLDKWITAYAAAKFCKNLRNQYAHCRWLTYDNKLVFVDLDNHARNSTEENEPLEIITIEPDLIQKQFKYFEYGLAYLYFVRDRLQRSLGKQDHDEPFPEPKSIPQPPRDSRSK